MRMPTRVVAVVAALPSGRLSPPMLIAAAAGVLLASSLPALPAPLYLLAAATSLMLIAALLPAAVRAVVLAGLLGALWFCLQAGSGLSQRLPVHLEGVDLLVEGVVADLPRQDGDATRFRFCPQRVWVDQQELMLGGCWRLGWYGPRRHGFQDPFAIDPAREAGSDEATPPPLGAGERWRLQVRLKRPRGLVNPGGFDSERAALQAGVTAVGYVRDPDSARQLEAGRGLQAWRSRLAERIDAVVDDPRLASLLRGLAVGDRRDFSDQDWRSLRRTGTSHLFAISGLHVGMVAAFAGLLGWLLTWIMPSLLQRAPRRLWMLPPALLAAAIYALLAGLQVPTQRAALMLAVVAVVIWRRRAVGLWQGWSLALCLVLAVDPMAVLGAGFWLSFLGVAWLLLAAQGRAKQSWWHSAWRAQWAVGLGLLPLGIVFFAQASWVAPVVNLVAIPWLSLLVVPPLLLALPLLSLAPTLGSMLINLVASVLSPLIHALDRLADWSPAATMIVQPGTVALICALAAVLVGLVPISARWRWLAVPLLLPLLWQPAQRPETGDFELQVLDVGQGTAVLVRTRRHALLFDTGAAFPSGRDVGSSVIVPALHALGVRRLDTLVISHADIDHAGGAGSVLAEFPVGRVLLGEPVPGLVGGPCIEPESWHWDEVDFHLSHPPARYPVDGNERSCVLKIAGAGGSALLTGDAGEVAEMRMLNLHRAHLTSDILLLGHHGSRHSSSGAFLDVVQPRLAIATSGYRNRYGHPHREVIERLQARDIDWLQLPDTGAVHIRIDRDDITVDRLREQRRRLWHER